MYTLVVENDYGEQLRLTNQEENYQILQIDGLSPSEADIFATDIAGVDGTMYQSSKLKSRNIVILLQINGNVEQNRLLLYNFFRAKQHITLYFKNGIRDVLIQGYVNSQECDFFAMAEQMQISIICPNPYFADRKDKQYQISRILGAFEFPFAFGANLIETGTITDDAIEFSTYEVNRQVGITNYSDNDKQGIICEIKATGIVTNPTIYNTTMNKYCKIRCTMQAGDLLVINSLSGQKSVTYYHNGIKENYLNYFDLGSSWLTVKRGVNVFIATDQFSGEKMETIVKFNPQYQGV